MVVEPPKEQRRRSGTGAAIAFGTNFAAGMAFFSGLGWWIDHRRGSGQGFSLAGIFLGLFYGGYELWKLIRLLNEEADESGKGPKDGNASGR